MSTHVKRQFGARQNHVRESGEGSELQGMKEILTSVVDGSDGVDLDITAREDIEHSSCRETVYIAT